MRLPLRSCTKLDEKVQPPSYSLEDASYFRRIEHHFGLHLIC